jgi:gamma-glutamyl hydrolase
VSLVEAYNYPFFMSQFHPEKNSYEWRIDARRSYNAVSIEQKFINQFTKVARLNQNRMEEEEWRQRWIYNYSPIFTPEDYYFPVVYLFDERGL